MFSYQPVNNHQELLKFVDGLSQEAGLDCKIRLPHSESKFPEGAAMEESLFRSYQNQHIEFLNQVRSQLALTIENWLTHNLPKESSRDDCRGNCTPR